MKKLRSEEAENLPAPSPPQDAEDISRVVEMAMDGFSVQEIIRETGFPAPYVRNLIKKAELEGKVKDAISEIKAEIIKDKVPILKDIAAHTLNGVLEFVQTDLSSKITCIKDAKDLVDMVGKLNEMIRLDEGKSTQNIGISATVTTYTQTREVIEQLKKYDPVFEYPELPHDSTRPDRSTE